MNSSIHPHPLYGSSLINCLNLLKENNSINAKYLARASQVGIASLLFSPLHLFEHLQLDGFINKMQITKEPIFIIGHWRSGTTHLHQVLSQDKNFGYVSSLQAWAPETFLCSKNLTQLILEKIMPETRPMDNVCISPNSPEEEEHAMANISTYSFYHSWYFPKKMRENFQNYVLFTGISQNKYDRWKELYLRILKKADLNMSGKQLLLKNPTNTARIKTLLELFPNAKFIHIYRNPYIVYTSTMNLHQKMMKLFAFQEISRNELEQNVFLFYKELMERFFADKKLIPSENLLEIKYEEFEANPLDELAKIYHNFNLPGFEQAVAHFNSYLQLKSNYQKNRFSLDQDTSKRIYQNWQYTIDTWQYHLPKN